MGKVVALLGEPLKTPELVDANMIRALRSPAGDAPCAEGLSAALRWIGDRSIPFAQALSEAREHPDVAQHVDWALQAIGCGCGYGYGSGYGAAAPPS